MDLMAHQRAWAKHLVIAVITDGTLVYTRHDNRSFFFFFFFRFRTCNVIDFYASVEYLHHLPTRTRVEQ